MFTDSSAEASALGSGPRGRRFKSALSENQTSVILLVVNSFLENVNYLWKTRAFSRNGEVNYLWKMSDLIIVPTFFVMTGRLKLHWLLLIPSTSSLKSSSV